MTGKLYIRTYRCPMDEYDSARMSRVLAQSDGLAPTDRPDDADDLLFDPCSVRGKARERMFHDLGRARARDAVRTRNPRVVDSAGAPVRAGRYVDRVVTAAHSHSLHGELAG